MSEFLSRDRAAQSDPTSNATRPAPGAPAPAAPPVGAAHGPRLADAVMAKVRGVDLDELSREEAIELGTQITQMFRAMGYADLSSEDYKMLSELMRKLTGRR